jgi:hypothetical protein
MSLIDDGDPVRGLGFITMYAAWLEEDVDDLLRMMDPIEAFDKAKQRWQISRKLRHAANIVRKLDSQYLVGLPEALERAVELFDRRNQFVHGRIYAGHNRIDYIKSGRPNAPTVTITSAELYDFANKIWNSRGHFIGPKFSRIPRAIANYLTQ